MAKERGYACQEAMKNWQYLVIVLVPILFCPVAIVFNNSIGHMAYCIIIMALYWMTECMPLAATALLPIILFPLFGIQKSKDVCSNYLTDTNTVFFGGLMVAAAVEHWNLHKRIALRVLMLVGAKPRWLMFGFMLTTAFLSMWMSNTATTAMMIPIAQAVLNELNSRDDDEEKMDGEDNKAFEYETPIDTHSKEKLDEENGIRLDDIVAGHIVHEPDPFPVAIKKAPLLSSSEEPESAGARGYRLLCKGITLSIPYAANIGGTATLTGTGPNLVISTQVESLYGSEAGLNFGTWLMYAFPGMVICLFICWIWLQIMYLDCWCLQRSDKSIGKDQEERAKKVIRNNYAALGPMTFAEWAVLGHFVILVCLWLTRDPKFISGWSIGFLQGYVTDATSVIFIALLLFAFPSRPPSFLCRRRRDDFGSEEKPAKISTLLTWPVIHEKMAWNVIILLGGGSALADACKVSGLSAWLGSQFSVFAGLPPAAMAIIISTIVAAFTEITSNTATATIFLPIFAELSTSLGYNPLYLMLPAAIACSFAFMLPVATPPNAIAFAHGNLSVVDMAKAGIVMNIACILVSNLSLNTFGVWVFDVKTFPSWANSTAAAITS